ncbi:hypothetical protein [Anaerocolumna aminovalerica]|uniref:hypothetical protein n=1 Tax=Anaerocolumna aminovalerica TaxID=1527 RepID=UPI00248B90A6|nr:hypothetical protein [Anaerocolumna aminovalerica]
MKNLKKIYSKLYREVILSKSFLDSRQLKRMSGKLDTYDRIQGNVILLVPHADDEWVGCSRLFNIESLNITLCNMDMQGGDTEELHKRRYSELSRTAQINNVPIENVNGSVGQKIVRLSSLIREIKPQYICVPFYYDWHSEHLEVIRILYEALSKLKNYEEIFLDVKILMYQVSVPISQQLITHCLAMSKKEQKDKWNMFRMVYKTQSFFPVRRYIYNEYISGGLCNAYAAEVFVCEKCLNWMAIIKSRTIDESKRKLLEENFTDIKKIRIISELFLKDTY